MSYTFKNRTPLAKGDFTSVGASLTLTDTTLGTVFTKANASGHSIAGMYKAAPATPYTITTCLKLNGVNPDTGQVDVGLGWSDGTKYVLLYINANQAGTNGILKLGVGKWNTTTSVSADYQQDNANYMGGSYIWLQFSDDGSNRISRVSRDGVNFSQLHSVGRTDFLTATRVGMFVNPIGGDINATVISWTGA